jgi:hypothetical protein
MVPKGDEILKAQVISRRKDHNGNPIGLIIDHALDATAIRADDGFYLDCYSKAIPKMTTRGWKLLVEWKDGNVLWVALKDMKELFPVKTASYAVANKIVHEPVLAW